MNSGCIRFDFGKLSTITVLSFCKGGLLAPLQSVRQAAFFYLELRRRLLLQQAGALKGLQEVVFGRQDYRIFFLSHRFTVSLH